MEIIAGLVSVVMATYNRSNVLGLAIESVRWQTYPHWELIVVGDCCTDNTAEVVASFNDPRISFYNLPVNVGEQCGPNNFGCRKARGEFIAFLNHDDLYFAHHLDNAVRLLHHEQPDLVFARRYSIGGHDQRTSTSTTPRLGTLEYEPQLFVPASCWVFRRALLDDIGPWRAWADLYNLPSQDWIFRAFKAGKTTRCTREVGVVVIASTVADDTYKTRRDAEQRTYYDLLRNTPDFVPPEAVIARAETRRQRRFRRLAEILTTPPTWGRLRNAMVSLSGAPLRQWVVRAFELFDQHPFAVEQFILQRGRKGRLAEHFRRRRGLPDKKLPKGGISNDPT